MMKKVIHKNQEYEHSFGLFESELLSYEARIACEFINKWGMVAGIPDGEDSAGRAKVRLATPAEVAERAVEVVKAAMTNFQREGWLLTVPEPVEKTKHEDRDE